MVIRGYPPSDLTFIIGRKTKKQANIPATLLIGHGKQKQKLFCSSQ